MGRWLVMDNGDFDGDGDIDIMLGSYIISPGKNYKPILDSWKDGKLDVMILENLARN